MLIEILGMFILGMCIKETDSTVAISSTYTLAKKFVLNLKTRRGIGVSFEP